MSTPAFISLIQKCQPKFTKKVPSTDEEALAYAGNYQTIFIKVTEAIEASGEEAVTKNPLFNGDPSNEFEKVCQDTYLAILTAVVADMRDGGALEPDEMRPLSECPWLFLSYFEYSEASVKHLKEIMALSPEAANVLDRYVYFADSMDLASWNPAETGSISDLISSLVPTTVTTTVTPSIVLAKSSGIDRSRAEAALPGKVELAEIRWQKIQKLKGVQWDTKLVGQLIVTYAVAGQEDMLIDPEKSSIRIPATLVDFKLAYDKMDDETLLRYLMAHGTKLFDALMFVSNKEAAWCFETGCAALSNEDMQIMITETSKAATVVTMLGLMRGHLGKSKEKQPKFMTSVLGWAKDQDETTLVLTTNDINRFDASFVKSVDLSMFGTKVQNRLALAINGLRRAKAFVDCNPVSRPDSKVPLDASNTPKFGSFDGYVEALRVRQCLIDSGFLAHPCWSCHPLTRSAAFMSLIPSLNNLAMAGIARICTAQQVTDMVQSKQLPPKADTESQMQVFASSGITVKSLLEIMEEPIFASSVGPLKALKASMASPTTT